MRYIDFSAISQDLKNEILLQCLRHDLIVEKVKDRILFLLDDLEKTNSICDTMFMEHYHWLFICYKLLCSIMDHSVNLYSQKPFDNDDLKPFLNDVEKRLISILEKNK